MNVLDSSKLPRRRGRGKCVPLYPHSALETNTIFEVVRAAGGHTAWADKHPAYELLNGPSGTGAADLYTPELTSLNVFRSTRSAVCTVQNAQNKHRAMINQTKRT